MPNGTKRLSGVDRRRVLQSIGVAGVAGLAGCADEEPDDGSGNTGDTGDTGGNGDSSTDENGDDGEIRMGGELITTIAAEISSYDPIEINDANTRSATGLVYEKLASIDFNLEPQPVLATGFEFPDETTCVVSLREGVSFHNGDPFTAEDVKASIERYQGSTREGLVDPWYDGSTVIDDHTIEFSLLTPFSPLVPEMFTEIQIVPKGVADGDIDLGETGPIGTGPYRFEDHQEDMLFRVVRNDDHWFEGSDTVPETPPIETVTFRIITEGSAQEAALMSGDVDAITNVPPGSVENIRNDDTVQLVEGAGGNFEDIHYPTQTDPWTNPKIRRGVTRLIPREDIINAVYRGNADPAHTQVPPVMERFAPAEFVEELAEEYVGYDPEAAAAELEEGFAEEGIEAPFETSIVVNEDPERTRWAQIIQNSLNESGFFDVDLEEFEWTTYLSKILSEDQIDRNEIVGLGITGSPSPFEYFSRNVTSGHIPPNCCNVGAYQNQEVDDLLQEAAETFDEDEQIELYKQLQEIIARDSPRGFIVWPAETNATKNAVRGWQTFYDPAWQFTTIYSPWADSVVWIDD